MFVPGCLGREQCILCTCCICKLGSEGIVPCSLGGPPTFFVYGRGTTFGPQSGERCWPLLARLWRVVAPLMKPWCAEGDVPTAANLNLYRGRSALSLLPLEFAGQHKKLPVKLMRGFGKFIFSSCICLL